MNKKYFFRVGIIAVGLIALVLMFMGGSSRTLRPPTHINSTLTPSSTNNLASTGGVLSAVEDKNYLDFTLPKLGGGEISLSEYRGKKAVVLDFWASWCPNCRRDLPHVQKFYEKYKDDVEVIAVNLSEKESVVKKYIDSQGFTFPVALDKGRVANLFGVRYTNVHYLIDREGNVVGEIPGDIRESDFLRLIES